MIADDEEFSCKYLNDEGCPYHLGCLASGYVGDCDHYKHENQILGGFII